MKALVGAFNQEKALVGAFSVIANLRMELFEALAATPLPIHLYSLYSDGAPIVEILSVRRHRDQQGKSARARFLHVDRVSNSPY